MSEFHYSIEVAATPEAVQQRWTQFEDFPDFMGGIRDVEQLGDDQLLWTAQVAGHRKTWRAQITESSAQRIAWEAIEGADNSGEVCFEPTPEGNTKVLLSLQAQPEGLVEKAADKAGLVQQQIKADLERFKSLVEDEA